MRNIKPSSPAPLYRIGLYEVVDAAQQSEYSALVDYCEFVVAVCEPAENTQGQERGIARSASDKSELTAQYATQRDGGMLYSYKACWTCVGDRICWSATVTRDGSPKGFPNGTIPKLNSLDAEAAVRILVEHSIEKLVHVTY
jgi:hypothetical protein